MVGLWLLQSRRVWYNLPLLFPGFSAFFFFFLKQLGKPQSLARRKGAKARVVWQRLAAAPCLAPRLVDLQARMPLGRRLNGG